MRPVPPCRICGKPARQKNARPWAVCGYVCHRERENRRKRVRPKQKPPSETEKHGGGR